MVTRRSRTRASTVTLPCVVISRRMNAQSARLEKRFLYIYIYINECAVVVTNIFPHSLSALAYHAHGHRQRLPLPLRLPLLLRLQQPWLYDRLGMMGERKKEKKSEGIWKSESTNVCVHRKLLSCAILLGLP